MPSVAKSWDVMTAGIAPNVRQQHYDVDVAEPPPNGLCYIPGHKRSAYKMYVAWLAWTSFYVGMSCYVAYRLPCWLHGNDC